MAGDWIKMRSNLWDDPRVSRLSGIVGKPECAVIGALYWLWATADQHSEDGILHGYNLQQIDRKVSLKGFAAGLVAVGWLEEHPDGVAIPRFGDHNGASAKARALTARRVANHKGRGGNGNGGGVSNALPESLSEREQIVSGALPREEKRREEVLDTPPQEGGGVTRKARATSIPPGFGITPGLREWAEREGFAPYLEAHLAHFLDYAAAKRPVYVDWEAAFRNAIRADWGDVRKTAQRTPATGEAAVAQYLARFNDAAH